MAPIRNRANSTSRTVSGPPLPPGALIQAAARSRRATTTVTAPTRGCGRKLRRGAHILVVVFTLCVIQAHVPPTPSAWRPCVEPLCRQAGGARQRVLPGDLHP